MPNKTVSTVYLRELVDTETFRKAQSKLNVSLGVDVAGEPVFLDIAKMPHLLIAGATGMGKSVCINSIITSLLYKAKPEEVKLILVDPKKVELNIYNGLPHLLVPVVSDPKKAAGSLHWAVTEMERRFELIEDVGVRDVKNYNNVTKDDPDREFLPQIVIIIDELADLMMTAPDDVEESICRLAQKARAAGMHLIIGTQRPSVDVITGLIKANVPSRIAFTVASQTDSRVVLDMAGAEKLIGRGDMLYAPVGASKPIRVQGAFVSESEVESIVAFIKDNDGGKAEYSSDIMDASTAPQPPCGSGKRGSPARRRYRRRRRPHAEAGDRACHRKRKDIDFAYTAPPFPRLRKSRKADRRHGKTRHSQPAGGSETTHSSDNQAAVYGNGSESERGAGVTVIWWCERLVFALSTEFL